MIFGGIDLTPYLLVTKVTRPIVPKVRLDETEVPGMDAHTFAPRASSPSR